MNKRKLRMEHFTLKLFLSNNPEKMQTPISLIQIINPYTLQTKKTSIHSNLNHGLVFLNKKCK